MENNSAKNPISLEISSFQTHTLWNMEYLSYLFINPLGLLGENIPFGKENRFYKKKKVNTYSCMNMLCGFFVLMAYQPV